MDDFEDAVGLVLMSEYVNSQATVGRFCSLAANCTKCRQSLGFPSMSQDFVYREEVSKLRALRLAQRAKADLVRFAEEFTA